MPLLAYAKFMRKDPQSPEEVSKEEVDLKEVIWWPPSLTAEIKKDWPDAMKQQGGYQLFLVQQGKVPNNYRSMPSIGVGVKEIKLQDDDKSQYRLIYIAKFEEAIYVINVITKKTSETTSTHDITLAKKRLSEVAEHRKQSKKK